LLLVPGIGQCFTQDCQGFPDQFELKYVLCRSEEKVQKLIREHGVPATASVQVCENAVRILWL